MNSKSSDFRFLNLITIGFIVCIITSNVCCSKLLQLGPIVLAGGTIFYPITFIFGDTLTEVYGYSASRKTIWLAFLSLLAFTAGTFIVQVLPAPTYWQNQEAYEKILGVMWRVNLASLTAFLCGEFFNSAVLAKLKVKVADNTPEGEAVNDGMALRFVLSTVAGQFADSLLFVTLGFIGTMPNDQIFSMFLSSWIVKVSWELAVLRLTVPFVKKLKTLENSDVVDRNTSFNPLEVSF